jgi:hypothetical protein
MEMDGDGVMGDWVSLFSSLLWLYFAQEYNKLLHDYEGKCVYA